MNSSDSVRLLKSLADPSRINIVSSLFEKSQYVEEIAQRHNLAISTVSFHLKKLEQAGLVYKVKEQYYVIYHLKKELLALTLKELLSINDEQKLAQDKRILNYKRKVINTFFSQGKLTRLPSQHKKRWVVYEKILEKFEVNKKYKEQLVNNILSEIYEDYCTIRRELVGENMMQRKNDIYWVTETNVDKAINETPKTRGLKNSFIEGVVESSLKKSPKKEKTAGIYRVFNKKNKRMLIDLSTNLDANLKRHIAQLELGEHRNLELQADWNLQSAEDFYFEVVEIVKPDETVDKGFRVTLKEQLAVYRDLHFDKLY